MCHLFLWGMCVIRDFTTVEREGYVLKQQFSAAHQSHFKNVSKRFFFHYSRIYYFNVPYYLISLLTGNTPNQFIDWQYTRITSCRFLFLCKDLILRFCHFISNHENKNPQATIFCCNYILLTTVEKYKHNFNICQKCFTRFCMDIKFLHLH